MTLLLVDLLGAGNCAVIHAQAGTAIKTSLPVELSGQGSGFSSTDLLAAALGTCMGSSISSVCERSHIQLSRLRLTIDKKLDLRTRTIESIDVVITVLGKLNHQMAATIMNSANACMVKKHLKDIRINIAFNYVDNN
jgi:putative redox protein